jgi:predicted nuclease of predicted toxin-antitoxin system
MSRPRFLADHDLNEHILDGVLRREPAIELVRARDVGMSKKQDPEVLEYCASQGLIIVSHDVNTMTDGAYARMAEGKPMAGLLLVQQTKPIREIIESVILIWSASEAEEWHDVVCFLPI